jgi:hypothetical protein
MAARQEITMLKSSVLQIRLSAEEKTALREAAAAAKLPMSALIRSLLQQGLTQDTPTEPDPEPFEPLNFLCRQCSLAGFACCGACRQMARQNGL